VLGPAGSPVRLVRPWADGPRPPAATVQVTERAGCDPDPLDATTADGRLALTSYVWADQRDRLERLRGALEVAARVPATVVQRGAAAWLAEVLAEPARGVVTVVWHSVVRQYLGPDERADVERLVAEAGGRSTPAAPLVHAWLEPERAPGQDPVFRVQARAWPGAGELRHLADAHGHGPPVRWTGAGLG
jgi:hypothetical protein